MQWVIVPKPKVRIKRLSADRLAFITAWGGIALVPASILCFGSVGGLEPGQWAAVYWLAIGLEAVALAAALRARPSPARQKSIRLASTALALGLLSALAYLLLMAVFGV